MADPNVNPNALGAPTEGFGQTVSFAFDPRGVTPALSLPKSHPSGMGVQGASRSQGSNPNEALRPVRSDGTAAFLQSVGAEILGPLIEKERNTQFVKGVQRAMQGEAVKDMATEQPWYSRIFGDTPMLEGARAYEANAAVNRAVSEQTANIESIKHLGADDAAKHFAGVLEKSLTGDAATDTLVSKGLIDAMPGLMKAQAKAYYAYGQKRASDAMSANIATGAAALQQMGQLYAEDKVNDKDFGVMTRQFIQSIMPPDGINEETYGKTMFANLKGMAANGQFHAIEAVRKSGGFAVLTPEQTNAVESALKSAATTHRNQYALNFIREIAEIKSDAYHPNDGLTPEAVAGRIEKMNTAYRKLTGSPTGLFTSDEAADMVNGTFNAIKAERAKAAEIAARQADKDRTAAQKTQDAQELSQLVQKHVVAGDVITARSFKGVSNEEIDLTFAALFKANPTKGSDMMRKAWVQSEGYVNPQIKAQLTAPLRVSEGQDLPSNEFYLAVDQYTALASGTGGPAFAASYFGEYAPKIEKFLRMTEGDKSGGADPLAYRVAMGLEGKAKPEALDKATRASLLKQISKSTSGILPKWMGGYGMRPDQLDFLADLAKEQAEDWRGVPGISDGLAVHRAVEGAIAGKRVEVIGGFAVNQTKVDPNRKSLRERASGKINVASDNIDGYFKDFLQKEKHVSAGEARIHAVPGKDEWTGTVAHDGVVEWVTFTGAEWESYAGTRNLEDTGPQAKVLPMNRVYGRSVEYAPISGIPMPVQAAPGIYADRKKWAEYRAKQEAESRARQAKQQP